jgi:hypothetical protein
MCFASTGRTYCEGLSLHLSYLWSAIYLNHELKIPLKGRISTVERLLDLDF